MASLVDYEDSDSDPDQERLSARPQPHLELYNDRPLIMSSSSSSSSSSSAQSSSGCTKRALLQPAAVRPYIPKRQRVSTAVVQTPETQDTRPSAGAHLLSEVSERVRPFLGRKHGRAELPRRLQCCVQAHQGPVNTLQWSPVDHLSHLLLSASMDKTCKVWDGVGGGRCLQTYSTHRGAVRDACWLPCGRRLLSGSFDGTAALTDVETGQTVAQMENGFKVTCVAPRPSDPDVFLSGGFSSEVKAWDARCRKVLRVYKAAVQQTLDVLFLSGGREFVSSTDAVSRDSAERTLIAWDFETTAKLSNQIFHERYTCPSLSAHPLDDSFIAQTNGGYIALFSSQRPYRMNKRRRYEGHKVEGFAVHCGFSADGSVLVSGSSTGSVHFYDYQSSRSLKTLDAHEHACVCAALHPVIPAVTATCDWTGEIKIWT
ncbi:WD repeat-containing protein 25 [Megalobrama amblycephala]|uniref:WD repeat-containing protein 25 n=1 Tax=Megalobrama amblycephala TaxID=75352 RepID=UPI00201408F5|nr:WD repeat-containing protein 25 [Megalobrama amblycephala]XP_048048019.1 WD repeat-containing protein 25 [Megalobrama amblycephala]